MVDKQVQYLRRNGLLIHGLEEKENESTDDLVLESINTKLEIDLQIEETDRRERIGKYRKGNGGKTRPIIVQFIPYSDIRKVFNNKKRLKGKNI